MKIIDLLNKIANDEYIPEKIIVNGIVLYYDPDLSDYYDKNGMNPLFGTNITLYLNDKIEDKGKYNIKVKKEK